MVRTIPKKRLVKTKLSELRIKGVIFGNFKDFKS